MKLTFLFFSFLVFLIASCASHEEERKPQDLALLGPDLAAAVPEPVGQSSGDGSPLFREAQEFDKLVRGNPTGEEIAEAKAKCKKNKENPFCFSLLKSKTLFEFKLSKIEKHPGVEVKPVAPIVADIKGTTVTNWKELRSANIPNLLKGIPQLSDASIELLTQKALKEKKCPNNMAVTLAATLEDLIPQKHNTALVTELYMKGARCARRQPVDLEHYKTRAALLHIQNGDCKKAVGILSQVKPTDAFSGRALYWLYRCEKELGQTEKSKKTYHRLTTLHPFSFHALLAYKMEGEDPAQNILSDKEIVQRRSKRNTNANQLLEQIEILKKYNFDFTAAVLVDWVESLKKVEPQVKLFAASFGDPHIKITTASEFLLKRSPLLSRSLLEFAYPKAFFPVFQKYGSSSINPYLAMSIARRESSFNPRAVSPANAQGLLQINPDTATKLLPSKKFDLLDPMENVELGTRILADLMQGEFNTLYLAIAAYNAGDVPVKTWLGRFPHTDPVLFIDLIPYRETRDYVASVLTNYYWYRRIYDGKDASIDLTP